MMADLSWKPIKLVVVGDHLLSFSENGTHSYRYLEISRVIAKAKRKAPVYSIKTDLGEVEATEDHRWLVNRARWRDTKSIEKHDHKIRFFTTPHPKPQINDDYMAGYIGGIMLDGTSRLTPEGMRHDKSSYWRVALTDFEALYRTQVYLEKFGVNLSIKPFSGGTNKPLMKIETWTSDLVERLLEIPKPRNNDDYRKGYLAGGFDAEGSMSQCVLRIANYDDEVNKRIKDYGSRFDYDFKIEDNGTVLRGGLEEQVRFFTETYPAITRKKMAILQSASTSPKDRAIKKGTWANLESVEKIGVKTVYDISTTSGTFFANGFFSHNCWAMLMGVSHEFKMMVDFSTLKDLEVRDCIIYLNSAHDTFCRKQRSSEDPNKIQEGTDVPVEWIRDMFKWIERQHPSITWMFVTKNPAGYLGWLKELTPLKDRVILGTTIETNRSMSMYSQAIKPQVRAWCMHHLSIKLGFKTMVSVEPMYLFDVKILASWLIRIKPMVVEIGLDGWAHRHKKKIPQPRVEDYLELKRRLDEAEIPVIEKPNLKKWLKTKTEEET